MSKGRKEVCVAALKVLRVSKGSLEHASWLVQGNSHILLHQSRATYFSRAFLQTRLPYFSSYFWLVSYTVYRRTDWLNLHSPVLYITIHGFAQVGRPFTDSWGARGLGWSTSTTRTLSINRKEQSLLIKLLSRQFRSPTPHFPQVWNKHIFFPTAIACSVLWQVRIIIGTKSKTSFQKYLQMCIY